MRWILIVLCSLCSSLQISAAEYSKILNLVPDDTAICLVIQGLRDRANAIANSPLADWIGTNYEGMEGSSAEIKKLKELESLLSTFLGVSVTDLRDEIFGDMIVLGYEPGPLSRPDEERGWIMIKARDPKKLMQLLEKLNTLQKTTGELDSIKEQRYQDEIIYQRSKKKLSGEYYWISEGVFVFAAQKESIFSIIDRKRTQPSKPNQLVKSIQRLGVEKSFMFCWFNTRKFDRLLLSHAQSAQGSEKEIRNHFATIWSAIDDLAFYIDAKSDIELGLATTYRVNALPVELRPFLGQQPRTSRLEQVVPENVLFAVAGRCSSQELVDAIASFTPKESRESFKQELVRSIGAVVGKEKVPGMLKSIGPDWAIWISPSADSDWFPNITLVTQLESSEPETASSVKNTLDFYLKLLQVQYNREHDDTIQAINQKYGEELATTFVNPTLFPTGVQPTFGVKENYLIFGSHPVCFSGFTPPKTQGEVSTSTRVFQISASSIRDYLDRNGDSLTKWIADRNNREKSAIIKDLNNLKNALKIVDHIDMTIEGTDSKRKVALKIRLVKPLSP